MKFKFTLTSLSPLLLHADDVELGDRLMEWRKDPKNKNMSVPGDDRSPPWTWQTYLYSDGQHLTIPADVLSACLMAGAAQMILKKQKTFKEVSQTGLFIVEDAFKIESNGKTIKVADITALQDLTFREQSEAVKKLGFTLFVKRAKVGTSKHVRVRARIENWSINGHLETLVPEITEERLNEMLRLCGFFKGLCDWRPGSKQSPGRFGRFEHTLTRV